MHLFLADYRTIVLVPGHCFKKSMSRLNLGLLIQFHNVIRLLGFLEHPEKILESQLVCCAHNVIDVVNFSTLDAFDVLVNCSRGCERDYRRLLKLTDTNNSAASLKFRRFVEVVIVVDEISALLSAPILCDAVMKTYLATIKFRPVPPTPFVASIMNISGSVLNRHTLSFLSLSDISAVRVVNFHCSSSKVVAISLCESLKLVKTTTLASGFPVAGPLQALR